MVFKPALVTELYVAGDWTNISSYVRDAQNVTIKRGRANEAKQADPQTCSMVLDNRDGRFSPRNPSGAYFGTIGRNTPIRVSLRQAADAFGRTVSSGWGTLDTGGTWNIGLGAGSPVNNSDWNVGSGVATHSVPTTSAYRVSFLDVLQWADVDVHVRWSTPTLASITGGAIEPGNIILRAVSNSDYYMVRVQVTTAGAIQIGLIHVDGTTIVAPITVTGITYSASDSYHVRAQIEGQTLRAKLWKHGTAEPLGWWAVGYDTVARTSSIGEVGIRSGVASGNSNTKPIVFQYDDFEVRQPRFAGEVSEWPRTWETSAKDSVVSIVAAGMTRRLQQGNATLKPALDRYLPTVAPTLWWPLEDGKNVTQGSPAAGTVPAIFQVNSLGNGAISWAADTTLPGTLQAPQLTKGGALYCSTGVDLGGTSWHVNWVQKSTITSGAQVLIGTYSTAILLMTTFTDGSIGIDLTTGNPLSPTTIISVGAPAVSTYDGQWWTFGLSAVQSGSDVNWTLWRNGSIVGTATSTSFVLRSLASVLLASPVNSSGVEFAHLAIWNTVPSNTVIQTIASAATGYNGELAGSRILRLCTEQVVDICVAGDFTATQAMGPQLPLDFLSLIRECAAVDMGTLAEARGTSALFYRTLQDKFNRPTHATASYSAHELGAPLAPTDDDQFTVNDVTVTRKNGSFYQIQLASGPLSVLDPGSGGVGHYTQSVTLNCATDLQLPYLAGWLLGLGTVDQARFPTLTFMREGNEVQANATLSQALLTANLDSKLVVTGTSALNLYDDLQQLISGYTETISSFGHKLVFNCVPDEPYHVGVLDDGVSRVDSAASYVNTAFNTTATSVSIKTTDGTLWTTDAAEAPFDILITGERMTVTAVSGSSSPQTFTVTRSVNGVVKAHGVDEQVTLFRPCYTGM